MYAHCADPDVLGAPFYVMERVDGVAMRRATELEARGPERTAAITKDLVDVLARLHAVDPDEVGLSEFGRPVGFLERQVRRWGQQLEGSKTQERPAAEELHRRLADAAPAVGEDPSALGIVHGDYRLDNCLVGRRRPDPRRGRLGDGHARRHPHRPRPDAGLRDAGPVRRAASWSPTSPRPTGYPDNAGQLAAYAAASGREPGDMGFHMALAYFKLAVILEGIHYRYLKGQTVGEGFDRIGEGFDLIVGAGLAELDR